MTLWRRLRALPRRRWRGGIWWDLVGGTEWDLVAPGGTWRYLVGPGGIWWYRMGRGGTGWDGVGSGGTGWDLVVPDGTGWDRVARHMNAAPQLSTPASVHGLPTMMPGVWGSCTRV